MAQEQRLAIDPNATITGFNYNFCMTVFKKARQVELDGKLYYDQGKESGKQTLTKLGAACFNQLELQLTGRNPGYDEETTLTDEAIFELFSAVRQFLAFFENAEQES